MNNTKQLSEPQNPIGRATMSSGLPAAQRYHAYIFRSLKPFLGARVWEIGCGYGQYTKMLLGASIEVLASDIDQEMLTSLAALERRYPGKLRPSYVDLASPKSVIDCGSAWKADSVLCLNVLEHIEDDVASLTSVRTAVEAGTAAVFLTPALPLLFGFMDSEAGHYRRYTRATLARSFEQAGWRVVRSFYLNPIGGAGWLVRSRILPQPKLGGLDAPEVNNDIAFFDKYCVPVTALLDPLTGRFFGQSVVVVARKQ